MSPEGRDLSYLIDMLKYSREVTDLISKENRISFQNNRVKRLALERLLEIIGKTANNVSKEK